MRKSSIIIIGALLVACGEATLHVAPRRAEVDVLVRVPCETSDCEPTAVASPVETGRPAPTMLALGNAHSCALTEDGGIYCWGANHQGQLGDVGVEDTPIPRRVPGLGQMAAVWAGYEMTCAREAGDGTLHCWGDTGLGPHREPSFATPLPFAGVHAMALGYRSGCFADEAHVFCWGDYGVPHGPVFDSPQRVDARVTGLAAGMQRHCGLDDRGRVNCWGRPFAYWTPERVRDPVWRLEGLAGVQELALAGGPQGRPWIVDREGRVQRTDVGQATRDQRSHAVALHPVSGIEAPEHLVAGGSHACARLSNGTAACWGFNSAGQVGDGTTAERRAATYLSLTGVREIAAGDRHSCAIADGGLYCWGANDDGQAGAESPSSLHEPTEVPW